MTDDERGALLQEHSRATGHGWRSGDGHTYGDWRTCPHLGCVVLQIAEGIEPVPVKPMKQWHNSKYAGEGLGSAGPFRLVIRTDRKTLERYVEMVHDDDAGGYGMTRNQVAKLIPLLQLASKRLKV